MEDYSAKPIQSTTVTEEKKKSLALLPNHLQTSTQIQKFFDDAIDHWFTPENTIKQSGYIGSPISDPSTASIYLPEATEDRTNYQLSPTFSSSNGKTSDNLFYPDLVNNLESFGSLTNNHERLFGTDFFTWSPPINIDMMLNYSNYFWVNDFASIEINVYDPIVITANKNPLQIIGTFYAYDFGSYKNEKNTNGDIIQTNFHNIPASAGDIVLFDNVIGSTLYESGVPYQVILGEDGRVLELLDARTNFISDIIGKDQYTLMNGLELKNGHRLVILFDTNDELNGNTYIVNNVGKSIEIILDSVPDIDGVPDYTDRTTRYNPLQLSPISVDNIKPEYIVIERNAKDGNLWSRTNNWVHIDIITDASVSLSHVTVATKSIIEYFRDIKISNFGENQIPSVDYVFEVFDDNVNERDIHPIEFINKLNSGATVDGKSANEYLGKHILFKSNESSHGDPLVNKVCRIERQDKDEGISDDIYFISVVINGDDPTGTPFKGDTVLSLEDISQYYWNANDWIGIQNGNIQYKTTTDQYVFFEVYDVDNVVLPVDKFEHTGCSLIQYDQKDKTLPYAHDINYNKFGHVIFEMTSDTRYEDSPFYKINGEYYSVWMKASETTQQPAVKYYDIETNILQNSITEIIREYKLSFPSTKRDVSLYINDQRVDSNMYNTDVSDDDIIQSVVIDPAVALSINDTLLIELSVNGRSDIGDSYFKLPKNLTHNPLGEHVTYISINESLEHLATILNNQDGFRGETHGVNNYNNSKKDNTLGIQIIKSENSLVPLMAHVSNETYDIKDAINYNKTEYIRFYKKFLIKLNDLYNTTSLLVPHTAEQYVKDIIASLNVAKSSDFPFWNTGVAFENSCIPATPSFLGLTPSYAPTYNETSITAHDGTKIERYGDEPDQTLTYINRDQIIFELETMIFNSINAKFTDPDYIPVVSQYTVRPSTNRITDYTLEEYNKVQTTPFEEMSVLSELDYKTNKFFDKNDEFTWNWSSVNDITGSKSEASTASIMMKFYDTVDPSISPWNMLGFSIMPDWWESEYTRSYITNVSMWEDIRDGMVKRGARSGIDVRFIRPFININNLPVDSNGKLKSPLQQSLINTVPSDINKQTDWNFSDLGDVELAFNEQLGSSFNDVLVMFLLKPTIWASKFWDTLSVPTSIELSDTYHPKKISNIVGSTVYPLNPDMIGYSVWVSDKLISVNKNPQVYNNLITNSDVKLGYKVGGYTSDRELTLVSDNIGLIPQENTSISLYKSMYKREVYSGINVVLRNGLYDVYGYDTDSVEFKYFKPKYSGKKIAVDVLNGSFIKHLSFETEPSSLNYNTKLRSKQEVFEFILGYGEYLMSTGWIFEDVANGHSLDWDSMGIWFLTWALGNIKEGDFINLSPTFNEVKFLSEHGSVQNITQNIGGSWAILDQHYKGISSSEISTNRIGTIFSAYFKELNDKRINLVKLDIKEYDHCIVIDNKTEFNDDIYIQPLGIYQERLRLLGSKTGDWTGRLEGGGYIVLENGTLPNFEKLVNDFRSYYDNDSPVNSVTLDELSNKLIGFKTRKYLTDFSVERKGQLEIYKGSIKNKGTLASFENVIRATKNISNQDVKINEEWAFKTAEFGSPITDNLLEFKLRPENLKSTPQVVCFGNENVSGSGEFYATNDVDWITPNYNKPQFPLIGTVFNNTEFEMPVIYDSVTDNTEFRLNKWIPSEQVIPGIGDVEISYKLTTDPSIYRGDVEDDGIQVMYSDGWGDLHIGDLWWNRDGLTYKIDLPIVHVDDQSKIEFIRSNWGVIDQGEVELLEWVKSPVVPELWTDYVETQSELNKKSNNWYPTGTPVQFDWTPENETISKPRYKCVRSVEHDFDLDTSKTWYHFWIKNPSSVPNVGSRSISAAQVKRIIIDPTRLNIPWFSPIYSENGSSAFIFSGVGDNINNSSKVLQVKFNASTINENLSNTHIKYELIKDNTNNKVNEYLWGVLSTGLLGYDEIKYNTNSYEYMLDPMSAVLQIEIPHKSLKGKHRYGNSIRYKSQSLFIDIKEARRNFTDVVNGYYASVTAVSDSTIIPYLDTVTFKNRNENGDIVDKTINLLDEGYYTYIDWYEDGVSLNDINYSIKSIDDRDDLDVRIGDIVYIEGNDVVGWNMFKYTESSGDYFWESVGSEKSTIALTSKISDDTLMSYDRPLADISIYRSETEAVVESIIGSLGNNQTHTLIRMTEYVLHEQPSIDWAFKTSYISISGITEDLDTRPVQTKSQSESLLDYYDDVKPYKTKIREAIKECSTDIETASIEVSESNVKSIRLLYDFVSVEPDSYEYQYDEHGRVIIDATTQDGRKPNLLTGEYGTNMPKPRYPLMKPSTSEHNDAYNHQRNIIYKNELYHYTKNVFDIASDRIWIKNEDSDFYHDVGKYVTSIVPVLPLGRSYTTGTYLVTTSTNGAGTGLTLRIKVEDTFNATGVIVETQLEDIGIGYEVGDIVEVVVDSTPTGTGGQYAVTSVGSSIIPLDDSDGDGYFDENGNYDIKDLHLHTVLGELGNEVSFDLESPLFHYRLLSLANRMKISNPLLTNEEIYTRLGAGYKGYSISGAVDYTEIDRPNADHGSDDFDVHFENVGSGSDSYNQIMTNPVSASDKLSKDYGFITYELENENIGVIGTRLIELEEYTFDTNRIHVFHTDSLTGAVIYTDWFNIIAKPFDVATPFYVGEYMYDASYDIYRCISNTSTGYDATDWFFIGTARDTGNLTDDIVGYIEIETRPYTEYDGIQLSVINHEYMFDRTISSSFSGEDQLLTTLDSNSNIEIHGGEYRSIEKNTNKSGKADQRVDTCIQEGFQIKLFQTDNAEFYANSTIASTLPINWLGFSTSFDIPYSTLPTMAKTMAEYLYGTIETDTITDKRIVVETLVDLLSDVQDEVVRVVTTNGIIDSNERFVYDTTLYELQLIIDDMNNQDWSRTILVYHIEEYSNRVSDAKDLILLQIDTYTPYELVLRQYITDTLDLVIALLNDEANTDTPSTLIGMSTELTEYLATIKRNGTLQNFEYITEQNKHIRYAITPVDGIPVIIEESKIDESKDDTNRFFNTFDSAKTFVAYQQVNIAPNGLSSIIKNIIVGIDKETEKAEMAMVEGFDTEIEVKYHESSYFIPNVDITEYQLLAGDTNAETEVKISFGINSYFDWTDTDNIDPYTEIRNDVYISMLNDGIWSEYIKVTVERREEHKFVLYEPIGSNGSYDFGHDADVDEDMLSQVVTTLLPCVSFYNNRDDFIVVGIDNNDNGNYTDIGDIDNTGNITLEVTNIVSNPLKPPMPGTITIGSIMTGQTVIAKTITDDTEIITFETLESKNVHSDDKPKYSNDEIVMFGFRMYQTSDNQWAVRRISDEKSTILTEALDDSNGYKSNDLTIYAKLTNVDGSITDTNYQNTSIAPTVIPVMPVGVEPHLHAVVSEVEGYMVDFGWYVQVGDLIYWDNGLSDWVLDRTEISVDDITTLLDTSSTHRTGSVWVNDECIRYNDYISHDIGGGIVITKLIHLTRGYHDTPITKHEISDTYVYNGNISEAPPTVIFDHRNVIDGNHNTYTDEFSITNNLVGRPSDMSGLASFLQEKQVSNVHHVIRI